MTIDEKIEEKNTLMADICGSGEVTADGKYVKFTVQQMEELTDYLYEKYTPNTEVQKEREEASDKTWYFEGDELVIKKGKWVIDRYKKHKTERSPLDKATRIDLTPTLSQTKRGK
jgi:hypothetical protein